MQTRAKTVIKLKAERQTDLQGPPVPGLAPAVAPAAPAAPLLAGGVAQILYGIVELQGRLNRMERELAINGNIKRGAGYDIPYTEVLFVDGSQPSLAVPAQPTQPGRAALPPLLDVDCIRNLTGPQATQYLKGHGVVPIPRAVPARRSRVARCVGCSIEP
ncbi:hypothetical protein B0H11DRAFT_251579 [Mycena galericulata]|nr:hypothetical protein B0H11DRAFT_251579 [Mycena galericulata]